MAFLWFCRYSLGNYHKAPVDLGIFAGGQGDQLVTVTGFHAGIVQGIAAAIFDIGIEMILIGGIHEQVILEGRIEGRFNPKHENDLIGLPLF